MRIHFDRSFLAVLALAVVCAGPAAASVSVVNGLTHERRARPGDSYAGEVIVANGSDEPSTVKLYQTDYRFEANGKAYYDEVGSVARSNGKWVTLGAPSFLSLAPHEQAVVPFSVAVPAKSDLVGTYWSVLMVEEIPADLLAPDPREQSLGVRNVLRYAVQLVTNVGEPPPDDFRLASMRLEAQDREHLGLLRAELVNTGTTLFRADLRVQLFDEEGREIGAFLAGRRRLYPETSVGYTADLTAVPQGNYKMILTVRMASGTLYASEFVLAAD